MRNFLCSVLDIVPALNDLDLFPENCPEQDDLFPSFATVVIVVITAIALFFR